MQYLNRTSTLVLTGALALGACTKEKEAAPAHDPNAPLGVVTAGLKTPESVLWDAKHGVWYISNINGAPPGKDDNGFIVRVGPLGEARDSVPFINGADADITLNAPKGMALVSDTLWVSDIDAVRAFDVNTGKEVATIDLSKMGVAFLNDVTAGSDGTIYITDTGIAFKDDGSVAHVAPSRVLQVKGRTASEAVVLPKESGANGIDCATADGSCLIIGFTGKDVFSWTPGSKTATVAGQFVGGGDGLVVLKDGRALLTSWADSSLTAFANGAATTARKGLASPADLGYDPARDIVGVPLFTLDRVEFWSVKP